MQTTKKQRTVNQNKAIHLWFEQVADVAQSEALTLDQIVMPSMELPMTKEIVKELWKSVQYKLYGTYSTAEMTSDQVDKIYDVLNKHLGQNVGIFVPFPDVTSKILNDETTT